MKLEIRKETKPDGDMYYEVYQDGRFLKSYWIGNHLTGDKGAYDGKVGEEAALAKAQAYYDKVKANAQTEPITEIIQSEEI